MILQFDSLIGSRRGGKYDLMTIISRIRTLGGRSVTYLGRYDKFDMNHTRTHAFSDRPIMTSFGMGHLHGYLSRVDVALGTFAPSSVK